MVNRIRRKLCQENKMVNRIRCKLCQDVIESKFRHDFQECKCGAVFVDGGLDYFRMGGGLENIERWNEVTQEFESYSDTE